MQKISVFCALTRCELQILERIRCRLDNMKRRPIYILPKEINQLPSRIIRTQFAIANGINVFAELVCHLWLLMYESYDQTYF